MKAPQIDSKPPSEVENVIAEPVQGTVSRRTVRHTLSLAFGSLGAVYGDIGTSPLYVMDSIKIPHKEPTRDDIYGCCSIVFWLFVILVFFKYTLIVLNLGANDGEGGQIAIYTKIARHLRFGPRGPRVHVPGAAGPSDLDILKRSNTLSSELTEPSSWKENPKVVRAVSLFSLALGFLGCSLVLSDGLLTPTTTALTAVSGIQVAVPSLTSIVGIAEAILVVLFFLQFLGSGKLSMLFAPIMFVWLMCLAVSGIYNIARYDPGVFRSLSPYYAINLMRGVGIDALGGGMLAITGTEAMFADLGHFGRLPIQIGITFTMICLMLTYLGQGAYLTKYPDQMANVFYTSIPGGVGNGFYWFLFVLAILSTIVASQALILGVFSIVQQLINLDCFPKLKVKRMSKTTKGKVFIPVANFLLFAGVWACTGAFQNSNNVTAAYGLGISMDFVVTSSLLILCMIFVYDFNPLVAVVYACIFMPLEFCLMIANMKKVPHGAWFPLMMCAIFFSFFTFWWHFRGKTVAKQIKCRVRLSTLFPELRQQPQAQPSKPVYVHDESRPDDHDHVHDHVHVADHGHDHAADRVDEDGEFVPFAPTLVSQDDSPDMLSSTKLSKSFAPKVAIIYSDTQSQDMESPNTVPLVYASLVRDFGTIPPVVIFCTLRASGVPVVEAEEKVLVVPTKIKGHYKAVIRFGFMEDMRVDGPLLAAMRSQLPDDHDIYTMGEWRALHVFEKNSVRSVLRPRTSNWFKLGLHYVRKALVEQVFQPINAAYQNDDRVVVDSADDADAKMFVGGILRI